jgi:LCP family protein required for cell wall assembly
MSGRHRRVEPDALADVDIAAALGPGPVIDTPTLEGSAYASVSAPPTPTLSGPTVVVGHRDRTAERAARHARARRRAMTVGAVVLAVVLVIGVVVVLTGEDGGTAGQTAGKRPASAPAKQSTLLIQAAALDGTAAASALVGLTPSKKTATAVLIPSGLLVDVASSGNMPFGEALTLPSQAASGDSLTDLMGVRVQHHWVLSGAGLSALVDKVGGVHAQVDADVVVKDAKGRETVLARAGSQQLAGPAAVAYATYLAEGEGDTARLARFNEVLDAVVRSLPGSAAEIALTLTALGQGSRSDLEPAALAERVSALRTAATAGGVRYEVLPTNEIDTGSEVGTYGLDSSKVGALLQSAFAGSLQTDAAGDAVRVLVENGVGTPDLNLAARARLVDAGLRFVNGGNAATLNNTPSAVMVKDGTEASHRRGVQVADALGLPEDSVGLNPRGQTVADVIVILGSDFKP